MFLKPRTLITNLPRNWIWFNRATTYQYQTNGWNSFNFCTKNEEQKVDFDKLDGGKMIC